MKEQLEWTARSGQVDCSPEEAGYNPQKLELLDQHYLDLIQRKKIQCASYLLSRGGKVFAWKSLGRLSYADEQKPLLPGSLRKMYSITKFFTAIAIMQLIEDGLIHMDQRVAEILKEFDTPMHKEISVFHLLTHTSGVYSDPGYFNEPYSRSWYENLPGTGSNWIKKVLAGPLHSKPGEAWSYSSAGFALLGEIVTRVTGIHYEQYVLDRITVPLGMDHTLFNVTETLYENVCMTSKWEDKGHDYPRTDRKGKPPRAGNGLFSTMHDLWKLGQMMLQNGTFQGTRILGKKSVELMTRNQLTTEYAYHWGANIKKYQFGMGLSLNDSCLVSPGTYSHEGYALSGLYVDPQEQFIAAFMAPPCDSGWVPEAILNSRAIMWSGII
jgi:CubicO group peptidase (beta-lactamase class C family)